VDKPTVISGAAAAKQDILHLVDRIGEIGFSAGRRGCCGALVAGPRPPTSGREKECGAKAHADGTALLNQSTLSSIRNDSMNAETVVLVMPTLSTGKRVLRNAPAHTESVIPYACDGKHHKIANPKPYKFNEEPGVILFTRDCEGSHLLSVAIAWYRVLVRYSAIHFRRAVAKTAATVVDYRQPQNIRSRRVYIEAYRPCREVTLR
jgi:hypothetical protein